MRHSSEVGEGVSWRVRGKAEMVQVVRGGAKGRES